MLTYCEKNRFSELDFERLMNIERVMFPKIVERQKEEQEKKREAAKQKPGPPKGTARKRPPRRRK